MKIDTVKRITDDALEKSREVYDEALTLFANVNNLVTPEVNTDQIKADAKELIKQGERIIENLDIEVSTHERLIEEFNDNIMLAKTLVER